MVVFVKTAKVRIDRLTGATIIDRRSQKRFKFKNLDDITIINLIQEGGWSRNALDSFDKRGIINKINGLIISEDKEKEFLDEKEFKRRLINLKETLSTHPENYTRTPLMITVGITNRCNLFCRHCGNNSSPYSSQQPSIESLVQILDEIAELEVMKLTITGGEPTLREDLETILEKAREVVPRLGITTNGYKAAHKQLDLIIKYVDVIKVSVDGMEKYHNWLRGKNDSFEEAIEFIKSLENKEVRIQSTLTRQNIQSLLELIIFSNQLPIKRLTIVPLAPIGRARQEDMATSYEYYNFIKKVLERRRDINYELEIRPLFSLSGKLGDIENIIGEKYKCEALITSLDILPDLSVIPCSFYHIKLGNLRESSIYEVWNNEKSEKVRKKILYREECRTCEHYSTCGGGCIANNIDGRDAYCWVK